MIHFRKKEENEKELDDRRRMLHSHAAEKDSKRKRIILIISGVVLVAVLALVGFGYYQNYVTPYGRAIITVDGQPIKMGYFIKRTKLAGADPMTMLEALTNELILKIDATQFVPDVTPADIDSGIREAADSESQTASSDNQVSPKKLTDSEFKEWYRQQLNETSLTDAEYRDIMRTNLLAIRLQAYLAERVPTVATQVHLYAIMVETYDEAVGLKERLDKGEDFAAIAREVSVDASGQDDGDIGWIPQGVLPDPLDSEAFALEIGKISEPLVTDYGAYIIKVTEKTDAREIDAESLDILKSRVLEKWLAEAMNNHTVSFNFDSETYAWINWQLAKQTPNQAGS